MRDPRAGPSRRRPPMLGRGVAEGDPETSNQAAEASKQARRWIGAVASRARPRRKRRSQDRRPRADTPMHAVPRDRENLDRWSPPRGCGELPRGNRTSSAATDRAHHDGRQRVLCRPHARAHSRPWKRQPWTSKWITMWPPRDGGSRSHVDHDVAREWIRGTRPLKPPAGRRSGRREENSSRCAGSRSVQCARGPRAPLVTTRSRTATAHLPVQSGRGVRTQNSQFRLRVLFIAGRRCQERVR